MRIFNEEKTKELKDYDLNEGYLKGDKLFVVHHEAQEEIQEQGHYETIAEYPNGGKDVEWVVDVPYSPAKEAYDEYERIQVYIPYTEEQKKNQLRERRSVECFSVINRGEFWYKRLTDEKKTELDVWYQAWLDVTSTMVEPLKPSWLKGD